MFKFVYNVIWLPIFCNPSVHRAYKYRRVSYSWFHENCSFSINSFNEHYLFIAQYAQAAQGTIFRHHSVDKLVPQRNNNKGEEIILFREELMYAEEQEISASIEER